MAAGHPRSAEAGAAVLREGGNAVDAAVAAVLMSFAAESPLTGPGAGGFMLVHTAGGEDHVLDFFVAAPGLGAGEGPDAAAAPRGGRDPEAAAALVPVEIRFSADAAQVFHVGPASCGVPGTLAGVTEAAVRFGSMSLAELCAPAARAAREGVEVTPIQGYLLDLLAPILRSTPEAAALYEPGGRPIRTGERIRLPDLGDLLERLGAQGPATLYGGDLGRETVAFLAERGGLITHEDLTAYRVVERPPARARYRGRDILTNPPPSSGGVLVTYALELLARIDRPGDLATLVEVMDRANEVRTGEFAAGLHADDFLEDFMAATAIEAHAGEVSSRLGSTTHVSVLDAEGACVSVTCSNGACSGVIVPGTGLHLNNMLGEQDLNPHGFGRQVPGRRVSSMMAPTVVLRDGRPEVALGSAGSNRLRSAILQTILGVVDEGLGAQEAVRRPRVHVENGVVDAEPGVDAEALAALEHGGRAVRRWRESNLYFGGVQAAARDHETGELSGGGDPRRGGAAVVV